MKHSILLLLIIPELLFGGVLSCRTGLERYAHERIEGFYEGRLRVIGRYKTDYYSDSENNVEHKMQELLRARAVKIIIGHIQTHYQSIINPSEIEKTIISAVDSGRIVYIVSLGEDFEGAMDIDVSEVLKSLEDQSSSVSELINGG